MNRPNGGQIARLPEPGDVGQLLVRGARTFAQRHKFITGGYMLGLLVIVFIGSGTQLSYQQRQKYNRIMDTIDLQAEYDATNTYWMARNAYQSTKGWFSCDGLCQRNKRRMEEAERSLNDIRKEGEARMSDAKAIAGLTSEVGVGEMKDSFNQYLTAGKQFAKRQSMWDAMFMMFRSMGSRHRDESTADFIIRFAMNVLLNFSIGLVMAFVMFVIGLWSIIRSYQPNPIMAVAVFVAAACAAFSFVATYLMVIYGAAAGGIYGLAKLAENQARLQNGPQGQPQRMQYRPHHD
jgi:cation transport ATPase